MTAGPAAAPTARQMRERIAHHFTVDVEEYYHVSALAPVAPRERWDGYETRVVESTTMLLELLEARGMRGTFFVLGLVAQRHPALVRRIAESGHEVASHGWGHRKVTASSPAEFRDSVRHSKELLEDLSGARVLGYRAPSFSIVPGTEWALEILIEEGYLYDSSLFPILRPGYGYAGAPGDRHRLRLRTGTLEEFPPATLQVGGLRVPAAGGAYLRLLPYGLVHGAFRQAERRGAPSTFYIHPWELDPRQPRFRVRLPTRVRHYGGLERTLPRLRRLLGNFLFRPIAAALDDRGRARPAPETGGAER